MPQQRQSRMCLVKDMFAGGHTVVSTLTQRNLITIAPTGAIVEGNGNALVVHLV